jgi:NADH:ubiquinone reductase (H+-translocating)
MIKANIPEVNKPRVVIIGGGFAGLKLLRTIMKSDFQIVLLDRNNFHQFQPLFYQVATAGLEPSAISFPFRKIFQGRKNIHFRVAEVFRVNTQKNCLETSIGLVNYDYLVIATGADTNYFQKEHVKNYSYPMKSISEAVAIRNHILENYEQALTSTESDEVDGLMNLIIAGGGPTGVEMAGAIAEMKKYILPKDYPELDFTKMNIYLLEASDHLLKGMSYHSAEKAHRYLEKLGVKVYLHSRVVDYDSKYVVLENGKKIRTYTLIWAAGIIGNSPEGISENLLIRNNRIKVNSECKVIGFKNIYAIGDVAYLTEDSYPDGHPQVAQVAIQQAKILGKNLNRMKKGKEFQPFHYRDLGSMATIGRNLAVVDLGILKFQGLIAWLFWMFVHLMSIVGVKNKILIFINWLWNYVTYDQSLRLIIRPKPKRTNT